MLYTQVPALVALLASAAGVSAVPAGTAEGLFDTELATRRALKRDADHLARISARDVIAHDAVVSLPETVSSGTMGDLMLKFQPKLKVFNGCVPFPAVDADGNTSGGLSPTGDPSGSCSSSTGQIYARGTTSTLTSGAAVAIMYAWYMPKDSPSSGLGHRHEWENAVVWLDSLSESASIVGLAVSQHGDYDHSSSPDLGGDDGVSPLVGYISYWPVNHQLIFTSTEGGDQPLVDWDAVGSVVQTALTDADFGDATVPFKDSTFEGNLEDAAL